MKVHLLAIDCQNDFCDPKGTLYVPGAEDDMKRIAAMIDRLRDRLDDIHATLDCHHFVDVAHSIFWRDTAGNHPSPFTIITANDVESGKWTPTKVGLTRRMLDYVKQLEKGGKYPLCIWPPHCLIGTWGNNVYPVVADAFHRWEEQFAMVNYVSKGSNVYTEHYSPFKAEVPDPADASTQLNSSLVNVFENEADMILICGEAASHCVASAGRDLSEGFKDNSAIKKMVFLKDGSSPVPGFENLRDSFVSDLAARGMQISTCAEILA